MQIVIPMSGFGERFRRAGYSLPKPLIEIDGKPIISHILDLFPGEQDILFICNEEHLATPGFRMREILNGCCPTGEVVAIPGHKLGPVHTVLQAADYISPDVPAIVNYCDFSCIWDYGAFKEMVATTGCDGAIAAYSGFHPHMLRSTNFAYMQEANKRVTAIQEKQPFTNFPQREYASSGAYYFASGVLLRDYFRRTRSREDLLVNNEYYVSMAYRPMLEDGLDIRLFEIEHFMQWGTPEDLRDFQYWSDAFKRKTSPAGKRPYHKGLVQIPMAGTGSRFRQEGHEVPKPLIPVSGAPMVVQAVRDLPQADRTVFVLRRELYELSEIRTALSVESADPAFVALDHMTDGQARTCMLGLDEQRDNQPLTIGACDNGALYDTVALQHLLDNPEIDVVVWGIRGYPGAGARPEAYGWIDADQMGRIRRVSVKEPLASPALDPIIVGTFSFKRAADFRRAAERLFARDGRVKNEFYVDSCINDAVEMGLRCQLFEIDSYLCWGTPDDLRSYEYWQSCFHLWTAHPYSLERDPDMPAMAER